MTTKQLPPKGGPGQAKTRRCLLITAGLALTAWSLGFPLSRSAAAQGPVELTRAASDGYISYSIRGSGTSGGVRLEICNHQIHIIEVQIEQGTELVPSEGDVQRMAVTRGYRISIRGHVENEPDVCRTADIEVACLDISLEPPSPTNASWTIRRPKPLQDFLACLDDGMRRAGTNSPSLQTELEQMRPFLLQAGLWEARGATEQQWVDFFVRYQHIPEGKARQLVGQIRPLLDQIIVGCGSLKRL